METLEILFLDESIIAVNKPSGIASHSLPSAPHGPSVETLLKKDFPEAQLVHRLDQGTSGVLLFARSQATYDAMREKFKLKKIRKFYRAWSNRLEPAPFPLPLKIQNSIAHHPKSDKRMVVLFDTLPSPKKISHRGKPIPAHSQIHVIRRALWCDQPATELEVEIITGVMHQIRVHLKHVQYPLWGDPIYNRETLESKSPNEIRLGLHAEKICFELNGFDYEIDASLPKERKLIS